MVILDTCGIIELCKTKPHFSNHILDKINKGAIILSVSFAEIACKIKAKKLSLDITTEELYENYSQIPSIQIINIGVEEWLDSIALNWEEKDPADRLLVGYAKKNNYYIITSDKKIKKYYKKTYW